MVPLGLTRGKRLGALHPRGEPALHVTASVAERAMAEAHSGHAQALHLARFDPQPRGDCGLREERIGLGARGRFEAKACSRH